MTQPLADIQVVHRFAPLRAELEKLRAVCRRLGSSHRAARWSVKDVVAHLLGGDVSILSRKRDAFQPPGPALANYSDLVAFINKLNEDWVVATRRMSPRLLRELLAATGPEVETYFSSLDPVATGEPVSWAGPEPAPVWLDLAREFTERWHHQQQIRDAAGRPPLYDSFFLAPVLETFMRGVPRAFREVTAAEGSVISLRISGEAGGHWYLEKSTNSWALSAEQTSEPLAQVSLPQHAAWRMFTKGLNAQAARNAAEVTGDESLAEPFFRTVSIIG